MRNSSEVNSQVESTLNPFIAGSSNAATLPGINQDNRTSAAAALAALTNAPPPTSDNLMSGITNANPFQSDMQVMMKAISELKNQVEQNQVEQSRNPPTSHRLEHTQDMRLQSSMAGMQPRRSGEDELDTSYTHQAAGSTMGLTIDLKLLKRMEKQLLAGTPVCLADLYSAKASRSNKGASGMLHAFARELDELYETDEASNKSCPSQTKFLFALTSVTELLRRLGFNMQQVNEFNIWIVGLLERFLWESVNLAHNHAWQFIQMQMQDFDIRSSTNIPFDIPVESRVTIYTHVLVKSKPSSFNTGNTTKTKDQMWPKDLPDESAEDGTPLCRMFILGMCNKGGKCKYSHDTEEVKSYKAKHLPKRA